jgi:hypothetical protein
MVTIYNTSYTTRDKRVTNTYSLLELVVVVVVVDLVEVVAFMEENRTKSV